MALREHTIEGSAGWPWERSHQALAWHLVLAERTVEPPLTHRYGTQNAHRLSATRLQGVGAKGTVSAT